MDYSIKQLAELSGVSTRTIRYYHEIKLLEPAYTTEAGYRIYTSNEVDLLQHILFYKELGVALEEIKQLVHDTGSNELQILESHFEHLQAKRFRLDAILKTLEQTIEHKKGGNNMKDQDKFTGFKEKLINDNETQYGEEIRQNYGDDIVDQSNAKMMGLSEQDYEAMRQVEADMFIQLKAGIAAGDPVSEPAQQAAALHKKWLSFTWHKYSTDAHRGLVDMYIADDRFTAYYDKHGSGTAEFLKQAVWEFTKE